MVHLKKIRCNLSDFDPNFSVTQTKLIVKPSINLDLNLNVETNQLSTVVPIEILEKIFMYLNKSEQLQCRLVCKNWFNIFSSSLRLDRTLNFHDSYLSWKTDPVEIFRNTKFKYNRITIGTGTTINRNDNLSAFWTSIGIEIKELFFIRKLYAMKNAFESGLTADHFPKLKHIIFDCPHNCDYSFIKNIPEWNTLLVQIEKITFTNGVCQFVRNAEQLYPEMEMPNVEKFHVYYKSDDIVKGLSGLNFPKLREFFILLDSNITLDALFKETTLNFGQLEYFFVEKIGKWEENIFDLITMNCINAKSIGVGMSDKFYVIESQKLKLIQTPEKYIDLKKTVEVMFQRLPTLSDIYFGIYSGDKVHQRILYSRTGVSSFIETEKSYRRFDEFYFSVLRYPGIMFNPNKIFGNYSGSFLFFQ